MPMSAMPEAISSIFRTPSSSEAPDRKTAAYCCIAAAYPVASANLHISFRVRYDPCDPEPYPWKLNSQVEGLPATVFGTFAAALPNTTISNNEFVPSRSHHGQIPRSLTYRHQACTTRFDHLMWAKALTMIIGWNTTHIIMNSWQYRYWFSVILHRRKSELFQ